VWAQDQQAVMMLLPFGVLSGEFDLTGHEDIDGDVIKNPEEHADQFRQQLPIFVSELYKYWADQRSAGPSTPEALRTRKIGRNEPCPCGSGLKHKACCGRAVN
jgi:uncharacterized protein YecA (UPF0149 family)